MGVLRLGENQSIWLVFCRALSISVYPSYFKLHLSHFALVPVTNVNKLPGAHGVFAFPQRE